ncbi:MAG: cobalamin biosynthesis protein [bacterium]
MKNVVLGVGCERGVRHQTVEDTVDRYLESQGLEEAQVSSWATIELKRDENGLKKAADRFQVELMFFDRDQLKTVTDIPNPSQVVEECIGVPGVAEPAAILASEQGSLEGPKTIYNEDSRKGMTLAHAY